MFSSALRSFTSNISSNYKISDNPISHAGPWRIFDAKHKASGKAVSVFVFDRKVLEPSSGGFARSNSTALKRVHDEIVERLRKEASTLARLRHPSILELAEPVEDTRNGGLMFATEQITASLTSLLGSQDDQEQENGYSGRSGRFVDNADAGQARRDAEVDELDMQKGLLQLAKGLEFLHESAGLIHGNLTTDAIVINAKSDWKITGFGFSGKFEGTTVATSTTPIALSEVLNPDPRLPTAVQLNLDYTSPDFVLDNNSCQESDMFSLGLLIIALYNSPHKSPIDSKMSITSYKRIFASSSTVPTQNNNFLSSTPLPASVKNVLARLITRRPAQRMSAKEFQQAEYFDNILVSTIRFLESLPAKSQNEKSQFLRGLPRIAPQFSNKILERKVLPALLEELKDKDLIALILQNVFKMVSQLPAAKQIFPAMIVPKLRETFPVVVDKKTGQTERDGAKDAGLMVVLENIETIAQNTTGKEFKDDVLPIIHFALDSPTHSLVDAALGTLPTILATLDFSSIKNEVFPVIASVFSKTSSLGIKIRGLEALRVLCGGLKGEAEDDGFGDFGNQSSKTKQNSVILDKYTIQEKVVPLLKAIKTKEPAVMIAALDVFTEIGKIADSEFLATDVLPILWAFSLGPLLNLQQFQSFMSLIKSLSTRVEQEHSRKLQEMSSSSTTVASRSDFMSFGSTNSANGASSNELSTNDFEALVLGRGSSTRPADSFDVWNNPAQIPSNQPPVVNASQQAAPTFAWSTPATTTHQPRATTPNFSSNTARPSATAGLAGVATLQPQASNLVGSQVLQPTRSHSSTSIAQSSANWTAPQQSSIWASTSAAAPSLNNTWSSSNPPTGSSAMSSLWSASNAPMSISPPPSSPYSSFNIAPPPLHGMKPAMSNTLNNLASPQQQQSVRQQQSQKQGLDKYESLI